MQTRGGIPWWQALWVCLAAVLACPAPAVSAGARPRPEVVRQLVSERILRPEAGTVLVAGEVIEVRWTALSAEVNECELLLSLDDGRELTVRLTPQLRGTTRELSWRVPNLPTSRARLRLRVGVAGREIESAASPPFTIIGSSTSPLTPLRFAYGEWWTSSIPGALRTGYPTSRPRFGPAPGKAGPALLALLPEEPVPSAPGANIVVLERPEGRRVCESAPTRELALHPVAPPQRE
ncbi:MAG: hypothetical protein LJE95_14565 [Acidobacteria bacterium]|nr:hypothetical protein [Acidobacteriota bacterium]